MKPLAKLQAGDVVDGVFLASGARIVTASAGARWKGAGDWRGLTLTLSDTSGSIRAFLSGCQGNADLVAFAHKWETVRVVGKAKPSKSGDEIEIAIDEIRYEAADPDALMPKALLSEAEYMNALEAMISALASPLHEIVTEVFENAWARFLRIPAAERKHHAQLGGLAQHTFEVASLAGAMADTWNTCGRPVNRDLCIAGALCHDIGKLDEYDGDGFPVTVGVGGLHGHIVTGAMRVYLAAERYADPILRDQLFHIILAHHGKLEYGSPVPPSDPEAYIVHVADVTSAWVQAYHETPSQQGALWARSAICGFVWKGDRHGIVGEEIEQQSPAPQLALFDDPKPAPSQPSPFRPPAMATTATASDDLDDPFL